jgi:ATP-dependent DNA helicase RecG
LIRQHDFVERADIDDLLWNVLPSWMDDKKKKIKINHLLTELSTKKIIMNIGTRINSKWVLFKAS